MAGDWTTKRLKADSQVGSEMILPLPLGILFGSVFVLAGMAGILLSLGVIKIGPVTPSWVGGAFGIFLLVMGGIVIGTFMRSVLISRTRRRSATAHAGSPVLLDYGWDETGFVANPWLKVVRSGLMLMAVAMFLIPFNYFIFRDESKKMGDLFLGDKTPFGKVVAFIGMGSNSLAGIAIVLADAVVIYGIFLWLWSVVRAIRFGNGRLVWGTFPIPPGAEAGLRFELPRAITKFAEAEVTLRCIREFYEDTHPRPGQTTRKLVHEQIWEDTRKVEGLGQEVMGGDLALRFSIPVEAPPTTLSAEDPVFWRADLHVKMTGPDYVASFMVPVYATDFPVANRAVRI